MEEYESNKTKKILFSSAMKGEWKKVIEMYKQDVSIYKARINPTGQTALHIAVSNGKEDVVKQMLHVMKLRQPNQEELVKALRTRNHRKNTALHSAASMGNATMCRLIAGMDPSLVDDRNADGETPLFLAALHGRKQAFLCLHSIRNPGMTTPPNCRRNNGDTILHCAINGDYFDLAFQIIHLYQDLANSVNEEGLSPLHLLASKPHAFRSGSRLGLMETIFYNLVRKPIDKKDIDAEDPGAGGDGSRANPLFPVNYGTCCDLINFFFLLLMTILGKGSEGLRKIYQKKETHTRSVQIVQKLLHHASMYEYEDDGSKPPEGFVQSIPQEYKPSSALDKEDKQLPKRRTKEAPILVAAKNGVMEIIEKIVELFPIAIHDLNEDKKNIVLLAVEHRQPHVYQFLLKNDIHKENLFRQLDKDENSALHLAARLGDYKPWLIPGEALQMQWEHKWYKFVKDEMPSDYFNRYNSKKETADAVFTKTHEKLEKSAADWLNKTSESCSVVAALIATVAFATASTVPGGVRQESGQPNSGHPILEDKLEFQLFAISALIALGCSITALVMFLSILTSRFQEQDFNKSLPRKLLVGLTSLFMSITSMLVSFCAGHFFVLMDELHYLALPIYVATCLPVTLFVLAQFPLYFDLLWATFTHVPQRSYRAS